MEAIQPDTPVAPLLFISLLENAFKHGADSRHPCFIHVELKQQGDSMRFMVINSLPQPSAEAEKCGGGVGQRNLMKRLQLLYPDVTPSCAEWRRIAPILPSGKNSPIRSIGQNSP